MAMTVQNIYFKIYINKSLDNQFEINETDFIQNVVETNKYCVKCKKTLSVNGYFVSVFHRTILTSTVYRQIVFYAIQRLYPEIQTITINLNLCPPDCDIIDIAWNIRILPLVWQRLELDNIMSWLSTLGGAFSALGDYFDHCAIIAAKISLKQFQIAMKLGDPPLQARCWLYFAISLIQQGKLKKAQNIIVKQYEVAKGHDDVRLKNMCHGIWAKLRYVKKKRRTGE